MDSASDLFSAHFGGEPALAVHAPGRVNLMGDHTDYCHLPVLPMAIQRGITIFAGPGTAGVEAVSEGEQHPVALGKNGAGPNPAWGAYLAGAIATLGEPAADLSARLAVSSDLPSTGGLASSSALTMAVLYALDRLWDLELSRETLVDMAARAERLVGVESGAMDQTVIAFAKPGAALRIDFEPPQWREVPLPAGISFVIGGSGATSHKGSTTKDDYNRSVVSCRAAAILLGQELDVDVGIPPILQKVVAASPSAVDSLPDGPSANDVAAMVGVDVAVLTTLSAGQFRGDEALGPGIAARHALSEAVRVDETEAALLSGDWAELGRLFDASHASLGALGVSTVELDGLTAAARAGGAWGARLTGAGFGGWAVAVCAPEAVADVVSAMIDATGGPAFAVEAGGGMA